MRIMLASLIGCIAATACVRTEDLIVWKAETPSPDGVWIASAGTVQNGGFGSRSVDTSVYLRRKTSSQLPTEILVFHCHGAVPHPYVLDNVANRGGTINLSMQWITPSHLQVSYSGHPDLNLQMVKYWGVEITAQDLSEPPKVVKSSH